MGCAPSKSDKDAFKKSVTRPPSTNSNVPANGMIT